MIAAVLTFRNASHGMEPTALLLTCIGLGALAYVVTLGLVSGQHLLSEARFFLAARKSLATLESAAISKAEPMVA